MKSNLFENFRTILSSRKFTSFYNGVDFMLPDGQTITLKLENVSRRFNEPGFRLAKFSYVAEIKTSQGLSGYGFAESESKILSIQKSIAESIERAIYFSLKPYFDLKTSNGWAVHLTAREAEKSGFNEVIERDSVLIHWLTKTPLNEIPSSEFPEWLRNWQSSELSRVKGRLQLLVPHLGHLPAVVAIINLPNKTYVSQGSSRFLESAIYKAITETTRICSMVKDGTTYASLGIRNDMAASAWDHAIHYADFESFPAWPFGAEITYSEAASRIRIAFKNFNQSKLNPNFKTFKCGPIYVSQSSSKSIQDLFFGGTDYADKNGLINHERLKAVVANYELNPQAHCVP